MTKPKILTSSEAASMKGVSLRQIQRLAKAGVLPAMRGPRNTLLFKASDVRKAPKSLV